MLYKPSAYRVFFCPISAQACPISARGVTFLIYFFYNEPRNEEDIW